MNESAAKYLRERGFEIDSLDPGGEAFALLTAKAQERAKSLGHENFPLTRAIVLEFCQMVTKAASKAKPGLLGKAFEEAVTASAMVRVFSDPALFNEWTKKGG